MYHSMPLKEGLLLESSVIVQAIAEKWETFFKFWK